MKPETWQNFIGQESLKLSRELPKLDDNVTSGALPGPALPEVEGVMGFDHQHGDIWRTDEWAIQWGCNGILYTFMGLNGIKWDLKIPVQMVDLTIYSGRKPTENNRLISGW